MRSLVAIAATTLCAALHAQDATPPAEPRATTPVFAEQITRDNFQRAIRGSGADAGLGDWMMSNGTLCASVSAPEHETYLSTRGGSLIDMGFCGRDDDQWDSYHDLINLSRADVIPAAQVTAQVSASSASILVTGNWGGLVNQTRYTLDRDHPGEMAIETTLTRREDSAAVYLYGSLILHTHRGLTPFVVSTANPAYNKGFRHPYVDTENRSEMTKVLFPADLNVLVGPDTGATHISYGVLSEVPQLLASSGEKTPLRQFSINNEDFSLIGNFANGLMFDTDGQPGAVQLAQTKFMDLDVGESLLIKRRILVTQTADVASITNQIYTGALIRGKTDGPENRILVTDTADHPLSFVAPQADGSFELRLPAGIEQAKLVLDTPFKQASKTLTVDAGTGPVVELESGDRNARLELPRGTIMRLVFKGAKGTADPMFFSDLRDFQVGKENIPTDVSANTISLAGIADDLDAIAVPPGDYTVYAMRGPEYSLEKAELHLQAGERQTLAIQPPHRVVDTPHWIAADFHVHSEFSFDSTLPARQRLGDFVAQGGEVMVATEHKRVFDYQPIIQQLGLQHQLIAITGTELTGMAHGERIARTIGHDNVFPLVENPMAYMGGGLPHENRRLGEVIADHKKLSADVVFQLNHPRWYKATRDDMYFLNHLSIDRNYDPTLPLDDENNRSLIEALPGTSYRDIDFDAIELQNGPSLNTYRAVREDWFSFLRQGYRKTGTGDSDSHNTRDVVAMPRNLVHMREDTDAIDHFDQTEFIGAIHRGNLFVSSGPFLDVRLENKGLGQMLAASHGTLSVRISKADWVPIERLTVYINGKPFKEIPATRAARYQIPISVDKDSFVTVEVAGTAAGDYAAVYPRFTPFAFTNPIYIDADGDGKWTAPGLERQ